METQWKMDWCLGLAPLLAALSTACLAQCEGDLNGNLTVDNDDLMMLLSQYGMDCDESLWLDPIISEIHYNPSSQQGNDSEYEFVELMNPISSPSTCLGGPLRTACHATSLKAP